MGRHALLSFDACLVGRGGSRFWGRVFDNLHQPTTLGDQSNIRIDGNCNAPLQVGSNSVVHIHGDLRSEVEINGMSELVIAGDVSKEARIATSGIVSVFVGGNCSGRVESDDSLRLYVHGDFDGLLLTGAPSAHVSVRGNCTGAIRPHKSAALLWLVVGGYAPFRVLQDAATHQYTQFDASVESCNRKPGLYPDSVTRKEFGERRSHLLWVIHRECRHVNGRPL